MISLMKPTSASPIKSSIMLSPLFANARRLACYQRSPMASCAGHLLRWATRPGLFRSPPSVNPECEILSEDFRDIRKCIAKCKSILTILPVFHGGLEVVKPPKTIGRIKALSPTLRRFTERLLMRQQPAPTQRIEAVDFKRAD